MHIDEKDRWTARLKIENERLKAQRDRLAIGYFWMRKALYDDSVDIVDAVMAREFGLVKREGKWEWVK